MKTLLLALAATVAIPGAAHAAPIITNGSFEDGIDPGSFTTLAPGDATSITGWTVGGAGVDYIGSYWNASNGNRSVDLSGPGPGSLSQTFGTILGRTYNVTFDLGGNPDGDPATKSISVLATGGTAQTYTGVRGPASNTVIYAPYTYQFTATGASTTLSFSDLDAGPFGAALDNVAVAGVPEPATWAMMIMGFGVVGGSMRQRRRAVLATA